ncbi:MAG: adenylosuccinate synthase [Firmicutes bacterium]|nr:adenylosuccinate synthase [Bacillota bacterium]MCL2255546.1 adenylosuccinate synthase [Bacillota bacterium]
MISAVVGINWGDEGKGRMVDLLSEDYDIICRYQGGNNAGHTIKNNKGKFILNLLPSAITREDKVNLLGAGMVIDAEYLVNEIRGLQEKGLKIKPDNLKISDKAHVCLSYHVRQDILEEERLCDKKFGSTRRGIAPCYSDKYMKKGVQMADLLDISYLRSIVPDFVEWKNLTLKSYGEKANSKKVLEILEKCAEFLSPYIIDSTEYLKDEIDKGKKVLFEAQLGALRDIDYGIYPFTTSSHTLAAYAPIGAGAPFVKLKRIVGVMKAYSSCVGEGPFVVEMDDEEAKALREEGSEYGAATGRARRVGAFDVVASRYGILAQGATEIALTKLDILSYLDRIPVCVAYELDGKRINHFPTGPALFRAKPIYEYLDGFKCDISKARKLSDLPKAAVDYIQFIEKSVGCPISYVSLGPARDEYITI